MTPQQTRDTACDWAEAFAADDTHGYDQGSRWGVPDTDCSALVILAFKQAGVGLTCTYTGNMRADMLSHHFRDVTKMVDLPSGTGLIRGDVLLHETHHTALYIGNGRIVHATGNEIGGVTGGRPGDQTGREVCVAGYFNYPWQCVLRYEGEEPSADPEPADSSSGTYTVRSGDMLGLIAVKFGTTIQALARLNNIADVNLIHPGQVLKLPGYNHEPTPAEDPDSARITVMARDVIAGKYGNGLTRALKLGKDYKAVQAEVNRLLAGN